MKTSLTIKKAAFDLNGDIKTPASPSKRVRVVVADPKDAEPGVQNTSPARIREARAKR